MRYFAGVDGGGSKTECVITDEFGQVVGWGRSPGSNHQTVGVEMAMANIREAVETALRVAKLPWAQLEHIVYGLAGADRPRDTELLRHALKALPAPSWRLVCDTMNGLRTGSESYTGVVLICGSGTNAAGRDENGNEVQIGGFGYSFGDFAGGNQLAREAFRMSIRSWEGRESPSLLTALVPSHLGFADVPSMREYYLDRGDPMSAVPGDLTILLHQAADEGDELASALLRRTGVELGLAAHAVCAHLDALHRPFQLVLVGSVLQKGRHPVLLSALDETLQARGWVYERVLPDVPPVFGALQLALDDGNVSVPVNQKRDWILASKPEFTTNRKGRQG